MDKNPNLKLVTDYYLHDRPYHIILKVKIDLNAWDLDDLSIQELLAIVNNDVGKLPFHEIKGFVSNEVKLSGLFLDLRKKTVSICMTVILDDCLPEVLENIKQLMDKNKIVISYGFGV